mgnify:CR=1 FL=1
MGARTDLQVPTMADFQNEKWERLEKKKKKGVLKNKKKTFVMIYCFARAQPKPTKKRRKRRRKYYYECQAVAPPYRQLRICMVAVIGKPSKAVVLPRF